MHFFNSFGISLATSDLNDSRHFMSNNTLNMTRIEATIALNRFKAKKLTMLQLRKSKSASLLFIAPSNAEFPEAFIIKVVNVCIFVIAE